MASVSSKTVTYSGFLMSIHDDGTSSYALVDPRDGMVSIPLARRVNNDFSMHHDVRMTIHCAYDFPEDVGRGTVETDDGEDFAVTVRLKGETYEGVLTSKGGGYTVFKVGDVNVMDEIDGFMGQWLDMVITQRIVR